MNWTDIATIAIVIGCTVYGWKKGFIVAGIEFIKGIASLLIARLFYIDFTNVMMGIFGDPTEKIQTHVRNYVYDLFQFNRESNASLSQGQMSDAVVSLKLPDEFASRIMDGIAKKMIDSTAGFVEEVTVHMSQMVLYGLGFLVLVLIILSLLSFVQVIGKYLSKLPIIKELNHGGGLMLGALIGVVSVYFVMSMLLFLRAFPWVQKVIASVETSQFAIYFYKYNIIKYLFNQLISNGPV